MLRTTFHYKKQNKAPKMSSGPKRQMSVKSTRKLVRIPTARNKRQCIQDGGQCEQAVTCSSNIMSERTVGIGTPRKRGHQHHPRNHGTRKKQAHSTEKIVYSNSEQPTVTNNANVVYNKICDNKSVPSDKEINSNLFDQNDTSNNNLNVKEIKSCDDKVPVKSKKPSKNYKDIPRPAAEGSSQSDAENEDPEQEELARLRCTSERAEVVAERETRRRNRRCADYPGLAFGSSIFASDTMMKFSIIRNELHNIMNTQLKRVCLKNNSIVNKMLEET